VLFLVFDASSYIQAHSAARRIGVSGRAARARAGRQ
jgi:hypothetical protein